MNALTEKKWGANCCKLLRLQFDVVETLGENLSRQKVEPAVSVAQRLVWSRNTPELVATPHSAGL